MKKLRLLLALAYLFAAGALLVPGSLYAQSNVFQIMGDPYQHTVAISTTNSSVLLTAAINTALGTTVDFTKAKAVIITCETNDARIAFGADAVKGASPVGHVLAAGTSMRIPSYKMFYSARIISKTADSHALLQVSLEY